MERKHVCSYTFILVSFYKQAILLILFQEIEESTLKNIVGETYDKSAVMVIV